MSTIPQISAGMFVQIHQKVHYDESLPVVGVNVPMSEKYLFPNHGELGGNKFLSMSAGWNKKGIGFSFSVTGKKKPFHSSNVQGIESDGIYLLIDTRNTLTISRANKFCHQFLLVPEYPGSKPGVGRCTQLPIQNGREQSPQLPSETFSVVSKKNNNGYQLSVWFANNQLNGFDSEVSLKISCSVMLKDKETGNLGYFIDGEFPIQMDPSLWSTLELK